MSSNTSAEAPDFGAEDWVEISQLISEYNFHLSAGNAEAYAALYTDDGTFIGLENRPVVGRKNLVDFIKRRSTSADLRRRTHLGSNIVIRGTPAGAKAESHQLAVEIVDGGYRLSGLHIKLDELRRENGKWRFYKRQSIPIARG